MPTKEFENITSKILALARTVEDTDLELVRDTIEEAFRAEINRRSGHQILLEKLAERDEQASHTSESRRHALSLEELARRDEEASQVSERPRHAWTLEELAERDLAAETARNTRVDLPPEARYGTNIFSQPGLNEDQPEDLRPEEVLKRLDAALKENAELREGITDLREKLALTSREAIEGSVESVVAETRDGIEEIPEVDLSQVPLFIGGRGSNPMAHLREHYGQWLTYFGAPRNHVWLHQVRTHDVRLVKALQHRFSKEAASIKVGDVIPTRVELGDEQLSGKTLAQIVQDATLTRLAYARLHQLLYKQPAS